MPAMISWLIRNRTRDDIHTMTSVGFGVLITRQEHRRQAGKMVLFEIGRDNSKPGTFRHRAFPP